MNRADRTESYSGAVRFSVEGAVFSVGGTLRSARFSPVYLMILWIFAGIYRKAVLYCFDEEEFLLTDH